MSLNIESTDSDLAALIQKFLTLNPGEDEAGSRISIPEYSEIKTKADVEVSKVEFGPVKDSLAALQIKADEFAKTLLQVGTAARKGKLSKLDLNTFASDDLAIRAEETARAQNATALKRAVEFQVAYVVMAYKAAVEKL